ncbi:FecR domain-containing protein [Winogradskyella sp. 3972H.M.0a.05]|uniref:FecR family protein n=1 Tax=Winogradskyella sp. 3972H.M.0a.05 TaxID=2950277 RepID=UPI0033909648
MQDEKKNKEFYLSEWIEGRLSNDELKQFVTDEDILVYQKMRKGIDVLGQLDTSLDDSFEVIKNNIEDSKSESGVNSKTWFIGIAASVILCFGLFTILKNDTTTFETGFGEQKVLALLDGSEVILNSKSTLSYNEDDWKNNRTLNLDGEAYFKVKSGSTFTVNTDNGYVKVLGTQFNVNSKGDYFEVVCYEGKVSVSTQDYESVLLPNNNVRKINGHATETWQTSAITPTWIRGESTFRSVPLRYVLTALEAQYQIEFDSSDIDDSVVYTGSFTHNNLEVALKTVFDALQVTYNEKESNVIKLFFD